MCCYYYKLLRPWYSTAQWGVISGHLSRGAFWKRCEHGGRNVGVLCPTLTRVHNMHKARCRASLPLSSSTPAHRAIYLYLGLHVQPTTTAPPHSLLVSKQPPLRACTVYTMTPAKGHSGCQFRPSFSGGFKQGFFSPRCSCSSTELKFSILCIIHPRCCWVVWGGFFYKILYRKSFFFFLSVTYCACLAVHELPVFGYVNQTVLVWSIDRREDGLYPFSIILALIHVCSWHWWKD